MNITITALPHPSITHHIDRPEYHSLLLLHSRDNLLRGAHCMCLHKQTQKPPLHGGVATGHQRHCVLVHLDPTCVARVPNPHTPPSHTTRPASEHIINHHTTRPYQRLVCGAAVAFAPACAIPITTSTTTPTCAHTQPHHGTPDRGVGISSMSAAIMVDLCTCVGCGYGHTCITLVAHRTVFQPQLNTVHTPCIPRACLSQPPPCSFPSHSA